jgi:hypothetical protein
VAARNAPHHVHWLTIGIPLKHENRRAFAKSRIVLHDHAIRKSINDVPDANVILDHLIIAVLRYPQLASRYKIANEI